MAASQRLNYKNRLKHAMKMNIYSNIVCLRIVKNFRKLTNTADDLCILKLICKEAHSCHIPIIVIITNATKGKSLYLLNFTFNRKNRIYSDKLTIPLNRWFYTSQDGSCTLFGTSGFDTNFGM